MFINEINSNYYYYFKSIIQQVPKNIKAENKIQVEKVINYCNK